MWSMCAEHLSANAIRSEEKRYAKATPIPLGSVEGPLIVLDEEGDAAVGDRFCDDLDELNDRLRDQLWETGNLPEDDAVARRVILDRIAELHIYPCAKMPKRIYAKDIVENLLEDYFEDAIGHVTGLEELQAFLDEWTEANIPDSWWHDFSRKIVLPKDFE